MMRRLERDEPVLLRLPNWVGDFVAAEPFVHALYEYFADVSAPERLRLAAPGHLLELFDGRFDGAGRIAVTRSALAVRTDVTRFRGHGAAILLTGSFRSALLARLAGIRRRIGWDRDLRGLLLTDAIGPPLERGAVPYGLGRVDLYPRILPRPVGAACHDLATALGIPMERIEPRLAVDPAAATAIAERLGRFGIGPDEPLIVANVGSRTDSAKRWPVDHWVRALDSLAMHHQGFPVVLVCGPGEEEHVTPIIDRALARNLYPLIEPPVGLQSLVALAGRARLFLTPDTGPRHIAAAVGAPIVCLFGPTDPRHTGQDLVTTESLRLELPCSPCHRERCPLRGHQRHACMQLLDPEKVLGAIRRVLERDETSLPQSSPQA